MNLILMIQRLYAELFSWAFDSEFDMERTFEELKDWHTTASPESKEKVKAQYAKIFKNKWFYLASPIIYMILKYNAMKYTNHEYLESLISKQFGGDDEH
ncbi:hypothetical protein GWK08_08905 [Leptobacterium flavescens]|uniref:Uncharacterized protein n=1 Tax=Leptobacterium flavescens TaxID=472055 RepID=A0A6P0URR2_9FLAO|nr:hypothetical protein [Leptobacterium flavescens]NER13553.1 hypothetical protein [Leptobacterium flavescens]